MLSTLLVGLLAAAILVVAAVDMLTTVVGVGSGRGPVTRYVSRALWSLFRQLHRLTGSQQVLSLGGPVILLAVITTWVVMTIAGWALAFGAEGALQGLQETTSVPGFGKVYFAAATVLGRGTPAYRPVGGAYQALEQVAGAMGVALFTLGIAYVIPVVNAAVQKRRVAAYISALGHTPRQVLERSWEDGDFGVLRLHLIALGPMINELAERHLAYPVLFYFHSIERHTAIGPSIAVLDETLSMLDCCAPGVQMKSSSVVPVRAAITEFLDTLYKAFIAAAETPLPRPDVPGLRELGIPMIDDDDVDEALEVLEGRRRLLKAMIEHDAWDWDEISRGAWTEGWAMELRDRARS